MRFENPQIFFLFIPTLLVIWFLLRQKTHLGFSTLSLIRGGITIRLDFLQKILLMVVISAVVAVLAGPYTEVAEKVTYQEARDLVIALDTSGSMASNFQGEEKLKTAKRVVRRFVETRAVDRIALISFESNPQIEWPLSFAEETTGHHDPILQKLEVLEAAGGTKVTEALYTALDLFDLQGESRGKAIILVSDGVSTIEDEDGEEIASRIEEGKIRLYWIFIRGDDSMPADHKLAYQSQGIATVIGLVDRVKGEIFETTPEGLANAFNKVSQLETSPVAFKEEVKRIYRLQSFLLIALAALVPAIIIEFVKEV